MSIVLVLTAVAFALFGSAETTLTVQEDFPLPPGSITSVVAADGSSVALGWSEPTRGYNTISHYEIERGGVLRGATPSRAGAYTDPTDDQASGTQLTYRVRTVNALGTSLSSPPHTVTVP